MNQLWRVIMVYLSHGHASVSRRVCFLGAGMNFWSTVTSNGEAIEKKFTGVYPDPTTIRVSPMRIPSSGAFCPKLNKNRQLPRQLPPRQVTYCAYCSCFIEISILHYSNFVTGLPTVLKEQTFTNLRGMNI